MRDACSTTLIKTGITPRTISATIDILSPIIDTHGWGWVQADVLWGPVTNAASFVTAEFLHSDDPGMAGATVAGSGDAVSIPSTLTGTNQNKMLKMEYVGRKRYIQVSMDVLIVSGTAFVSQTFRLGAPHEAVVTQTPT